jgi:hypothetical protein
LIGTPLMSKITEDELRAEYGRLCQVDYKDDKADWWTTMDMCKATGRGRKAIMLQIDRGMQDGVLEKSTKTFIKSDKTIGWAPCYRSVKPPADKKAKKK